MVTLNLTQMAAAAAAADHEEQSRKKFHEERIRKKAREEQRKKLDYTKVEEFEFEKWAVECKGERKRKRKQELVERRRKKIRVVEPNSFDEMIESVDALLASLESPVARTVGRGKVPEVFAMSEREYTSSPPTAIIEIAELDACENAVPMSNEIAIPKPSTQTTETGTKIAKADVCETATSVAACKENITAPAHPVIDFTTALHSNRPSSSDRAFARNLTNAHHARIIAAMSTHELALPTFDEVTEYDKVAPVKKKKKNTKMTFSKAVSKGFREIFGEEGCFSSGRL